MDTTVIYITANKISEHFGNNTRKYLVDSIGNLPLISVSKEPMNFGENIVTKGPSGYMGIYKDLLIGVKAAKTKYVAIAEDDVLYSAAHFTHTPPPDVFSYNKSVWSIFTWSKPPVFSFRGRHNNNALICERDLYIDAFEERFATFPDLDAVNLQFWAEPGKYERQLGVRERKMDWFHTEPPNIMFTHETGQSYLTGATRKRLGEVRAYTIPHWGSAEDIMKLYSI